MGMSHLGTLGGVITKSHMGRRHEVVDYIDRKWKIKRNFVNNCFLSLSRNTTYDRFLIEWTSKDNAVPFACLSSRASMESMQTSSEKASPGKLIL